jgi:hypothetical protein
LICLGIPGRPPEAWEQEVESWAARFEVPGGPRPSSHEAAKAGLPYAAAGRR